jgi:hypothetical protein
MSRWIILKIYHKALLELPICSKCDRFNQLPLKPSVEVLTLILLTWRIWWASNNASNWQMGFNSAFKVLTHIISPEGYFNARFHWICRLRAWNIFGHEASYFTCNDTWRCLSYGKKYCRSSIIIWFLLFFMFSSNRTPSVLLLIYGYFFLSLGHDFTT